MLLECLHCGAPLDVKPGAETNKCRYCRRVQQIRQLKTIAAETPAGWKPPQVWRPPPQADAPSNVELKYQGSGGGLGCIIAVLLCVGIPVGALIAKSGVLSRIDPAELDKVTFAESPKELMKKIGGTWTESARWVNVDLKDNWEYAIFNWDEKDMGHPSSFSVHNNSRKGCTPETTAILKKLRADLGPRFNDNGWQWGNLSISFDQKCAHFSMHATIPTSGDDDKKGDWKAMSEAMWKLVRADVFGRSSGRPTEDEMLLLASGHQASAIGAAISDLTIDDAEKTFTKKLKGTTFNTSGGLSAEIPLAHPRLGVVSLRFHNKKGGGISSFDVRSFGNNLTDHVAYARCLANKAGGTVEVREVDYAKKTQAATVKLEKLDVRLSQYGISTSAYGFDGLPTEPLRTLLEGIGKCTD